MGIVVKQSIRNSIFLFSGVGLGALNVMILFPLFLPKEIFGLTKVLIDIAILGSSFASFGMMHVFVKYLPDFRNKNKTEPGLLQLVLLSSFCGLTIITICLFLFEKSIIAYYAQKANLLGEYFYLIIPFVAFIMLIGIFSNYCKALLKSIFLKTELPKR